MTDASQLRGPTRPFVAGSPRTRYERANGSAQPLGTRPLLESWNARDDPAQVRLRTYRERIGKLAREPAALITGPLAVELKVALDSDAALMRFGDLDNYLTPVAVALKELAPVSFWGVKRVGGESTLTLAGGTDSLEPYR